MHIQIYNKCSWPQQQTRQILWSKGDYVFLYLTIIVFQQWQHYNVSNLAKNHCPVSNCSANKYFRIFTYKVIRWYLSYYEVISGSRKLLQIPPPDFDSSLLTCRRILQMQTYLSVTDTCRLSHLCFPIYVRRLYRFCFSWYARSNVRFFLLPIIWYIPIIQGWKSY